MLLKHYNFKTAELKAYTFQNPITIDKFLNTYRNQTPLIPADALLIYDSEAAFYVKYNLVGNVETVYFNNYFGVRPVINVYKTFI